MKFKELVPQGDYRNFIPDRLLDDDLTPESFVALGPYLVKQGMEDYETLGFISGAMELQEIVKGLKDDESRSAWFKTERVEEVRIFYRTSHHSSDRTLGSKMRLYSTGPSYANRDVIETQHIDSGFLTFSFSPGPTMIFQSALAMTMVQRALYCIGGPATVRKVSVPNKEGSSPPSYRWVSAMKPSFTEEVDRFGFTHLLHGATRAAGVEDDFFSVEFLDAFLELILTAKSFDELTEGLKNLPEELYDEEVDRIVKESNCPKANLSNATAKDFNESMGLNVVQTLKVIADIFAQAEGK